MKNQTYTERETKVFNNIINDYQKIDSDSELEKRGLTYKEYSYIGFPLDQLRYDKEFYTKSENVANWLEGFGCNITRYGDGEDFRIQL